MKYYITEKGTIKRIENKSENINAYKNIFFNSFHDAKEFVRNIYKTHLDDIGVTLCTSNFEFIKTLMEDLKCTKERYRVLDDDYRKYNLSLDDYINTEEWKIRKQLSQDYFHKEGQYLFYFIDYRDKKNKNRFIFNKNNCLLPTYVGFHGALDRDKSKDDELNSIKQQIRELKTSELLELEKEYHFKLDKLEQEYTDARIEYLKFHNQCREDNKRKNDLKNTIIDYTNKYDSLQEKIIINNMWLYSSSKDSGIVIKDLKDMTIDDIKYNKEKGYNIYVIRDNQVYKIKYVGNAYNRIAMIDEENRLVRNDSKILIDLYSDGEQLDYLNEDLDFFDKEEEFLKKETKLNDKLDNFFNKNIIK